MPGFFFRIIDNGRPDNTVIVWLSVQNLELVSHQPKDQKSIHTNTQLIETTKFKLS